MSNVGLTSKQGSSPPGVSGLTTRSVKLFGRSVQVRLEPSYWEGLDEICRREELTLAELVSDIKSRLDEQTRDGRRSAAVSLANAVRVFIVGYYRQAATESGHTRAGHGRGDPFVSTPFDTATVTESPPPKQAE